MDRRKFLKAAGIVTAGALSYPAYRFLRPKDGPVNFEQIPERVEDNAPREAKDLTTKDRKEYIEDNLTFGERESIRGNVWDDKRGGEREEINYRGRTFEMPPYYAAGLKKDERNIAVGWINWKAINLDLGKNRSKSKLDELDEKISSEDVIEVEARQMYWNGDPIVAEYEHPDSGEKFDVNLMETWELRNHIQSPTAGLEEELRQLSIKDF